MRTMEKEGRDTDAESVVIEGLKKVGEGASHMAV